jgi:hypothetical protein
MKATMARAALGTLAGVALLAGTGCKSAKSAPGITNPESPGPAAGRTAGVGVGAVVGNTAGAAVGFGEGVVAGAAKPFTKDTTQRVVRRWKTETTSDGRTILVPEEIVVDANGRPVGEPAPAK